MDPNAIVSLIGSLGFPIVCCGALFWYNAKIIRDFSAETRASIEKLSEAISANTAATSKLETTVEIMNKLGGEHIV